MNAIYNKKDLEIFTNSVLLGYVHY